MGIIRRSRLLILGLVTAVSLVVAGTGTALASTINQPALIYQCASIYWPCSPLYVLHTGQQVTMHCWLDAGWAYGTNRWFIVSENSSPWGEGYISANVVSAATQTRVGHC